MATAAWLHGSANMRLTEGLVSVLKEERPEYLPSLLANYREHGVVATQSCGAIGGLVGLSNARLGSSKTRFEGLCLLSVLVKDGSSELFQQHCLSWLRSLQQVIQSQAPVPSVQLAILVLQDVLQYSSQIPELAREIGLNSILGILTSLLSLKAECHLIAMEGMMACMTYYPRACGSLREKLGAYFLSKMDSDNPKVQEVACECYGRLPCLGGVLDRGGGGRRAESWTNQTHCLLASANGMLAQLYQGAETEGVVQYEGPGLELPFLPLDDIDPLLVLQLRHRYRALCLALKYTLSVDPGSPVRLPVQHVLNFVCRALAVSSKNINLTGDGSLKLLVLPSIHSDTLEVLSTLIKVVGSGLSQYSSVLTRLFSQSLSAWTPLPEASIGQQRAYSTVRVCLYRTLELWVRVGGASASVLQGSPTHSEILFTHLMGDLTPAADAMKLKVGPSAGSDMVAPAKAGPRRTKGLGLGDNGTMATQRKGDALANQDTCLSAIRVLRHIILNSGTLLKDELHKKLHDIVVPLCVRLQQQQQLCDVEMSGQYGSPAPRRELYRLLLALLLVPCPRLPPPLSCAVSLFSHGRHDRSLKVSSFCAEALAICNCLLHPRTPSISLPLPPLALKPTPAASVLPNQNPVLSLPNLLAGPSAGTPFPPRHPLSLGPVTLLGSLENHLSLGAPVLPPPAIPSTPGDLLLSPSQPADLAGLGAPEAPEAQRHIFIRFDKEEPEDVEISLESDSDDSVVIVPPGLLSQEGQDSASNSQTMPANPGPPAAQGPAAGPCPTTVPTVSGTEAVTSAEAALTTELPTPTSLPHQVLPATPSTSSSFPGSQAAPLVPLVPPLGSATPLAPPPPVGLGESLPSAQLQQMLMQPTPSPSQLGLSLQVQMHNHMSQLAVRQQQNLGEEEQTVININSTDDEDEEDEEIEDEDEMGEEEEEEGLEEEEEEEEGSDFPEEEEYYDGYEDYDEEEEEGEEIEDEEEEGIDDIPPLEGESERDMIDREEGEVIRPEEEEEERGMELFSVDRERLQGEGGDLVEEIKSGCEEEAEGGVKGADSLEEKEKSGVAESEDVISSAVQRDRERERAVGAEVEGQDEGTSGLEMDPQEVGSWEQKEALQEGVSSLPPAAAAAAGASGSEQNQGPGPEVRDLQQSRPDQEEPASCSDVSPAEKEARLQGVEEATVTEAEGEEKDGEGESRGLKRKLEDMEEGEPVQQGGEKKKLDDEAMASMLADFVDCPPDEEENPPSSPSNS
ncbi:hypothetical protein ACEWY4_025392 [Coilia grayii]|uniref:Modulator of non-genomic activity of estrogen receptor n=1 Tax=Coilia grayii TaxID=363190 RepID=A0ABD1IXI1_9TELE